MKAGSRRFIVPALIGAVVIVVAGAVLAANLYLSRVAPTTTQSSPSVVYVVGQDHSLSALNARDGAIRWHDTAVDGDILDPPVVADGNVYVPSLNSLVVVDANTGAPRWSFPVPGGDVHVDGLAVVSGVVYAGHDTDYYALDAKSGNPRWHTTVDVSGYFSAPTVLNGVVYLANQSSIYAFDAASGAQRWRFQPTAGGVDFTTPLVAADGRIYAVGEPPRSFDEVYALDARTGAPVWDYATETLGTTQLATGDSLVYAGGIGDHVYALSAADGSVRWKMSGGAFTLSSGVLYVDDVIVGAAEDVAAVNASTGAMMWSSAKPAIGGDDLGLAVAGGEVFLDNTTFHLDTTTFKEPSQNTLTAWDAASGQRRWSYQTMTTQDNSAAAVGMAVASGVVCVAVADTAGSGSYLYGVDGGSGTPLWKVKGGDQVIGAPVIASTG